MSYFISFYYNDCHSKIVSKSYFTSAYHLLYFYICKVQQLVILLTKLMPQSVGFTSLIIIFMISI